MAKTAEQSMAGKSGKAQTRSRATKREPYKKPDLRKGPRLGDATARNGKGSITADPV